MGILHEGKLAWQGTMEQVGAISSNKSFQVEFDSNEDMKKAIEAIKSQNINISNLEMKDSNLENLFMEVIGHETA